uniref:Sulfotransferase n=1 Tax=Apteryx owenii TaxID=8824 RepID=A0A8B9S7M1_APTOW
MVSPRQSGVTLVEGISIYKWFIKGWPQVEAFQARPNDLLICTYPKSGTTWLSEILDMIYHDDDMEKFKWDAIFNWVPFLEMKAPDMPNGGSCGIKLLAEMPSLRLVKTHLPVQLLLVSFWDQDCKVGAAADQGAPRGDPQPCGHWPAVAYGSWYAHVKDWWEKRKEKLGAPCCPPPSPWGQLACLPGRLPPQNPQHEVQKIAQFLGKEVAEGKVAKIVHHISFQEMRKNPTANYEPLPSWVMDHSLSSFLWKGGQPRFTGDWKNHFTVAQNERFDKCYKEQMEGSDLCFCMEI